MPVTALAFAVERGYSWEMDPEAFPFAPWRDYHTIVTWIAELTGASDGVVKQRLREEFDTPGTTVTQAFYEAELVAIHLERRAREILRGDRRLSLRVGHLEL